MVCHPAHAVSLPPWHNTCVLNSACRFRLFAFAGMAATRRVRLRTTRRVNRCIAGVSADFAGLNPHNCSKITESPLSFLPAVACTRTNNGQRI